MSAGNLDVAVFDDDDIAFSTPLVLDKPADTIFFDQIGSDWKLTSSESGNTFTLADSPYFILAMGGTGSWKGNTDFEKLAFGIYNVKWDADAKITMIDAQPVPLPPSIFILGAGLLGLIGYRRRN